ncbi:hypothetical protein GGQ88_000110 [Novosphingobium hassiacum]|uniref:Lipoprotein n=1 Tax=Novosphingobium hassiacum TaxID=173676 RepID=A0A7W5ZVW8_9SPHN|nr:hypothetical protein [Novosphingobium hassiacum]MBB3858870.1 hypothetical protein [Novosphingobium hassiacum]
MRKALILLALLGACRSETAQTPAPMPISGVTSVAEAFTPSDANTLRVTVTVGSSDPAIVRLYGWTPEQANQVRAYAADNGGALGRWALGPIASKPIMAGPPGVVELAAPARAGWFYAAAIEPLSAQNGGTFDVPRVSMSFGRD